MSGANNLILSALLNRGMKFPQSGMKFPQSIRRGNALCLPRIDEGTHKGHPYNHT
jgi:hypothetical protein